MSSPSSRRLFISKLASKKGKTISGLNLKKRKGTRLTEFRSGQRRFSAKIENRPRTECEQIKPFHHRPESWPDTMTKKLSDSLDCRIQSKTLPKQTKANRERKQKSINKCVKPIVAIFANVWTSFELFSKNALTTCRKGQKHVDSRTNLAIAEHSSSIRLCAQI